MTPCPSLGNECIKSDGNSLPPIPLSSSLQLSPFHLFCLNPSRFTCLASFRKLQLLLSVGAQTSESIRPWRQRRTGQQLVNNMWVYVSKLRCKAENEGTPHHQLLFITGLYLTLEVDAAHFHSSFSLDIGSYSHRCRSFSSKFRLVRLSPSDGTARLDWSSLT